MMRARGLELSGTEAAPDWASLDGMYSLPATEEIRRQGQGVNPGASFHVVRATPAELERADRHAPRPDARFHYRYVAADLAWDAARLMPDESDATARVLATAGTWLKTRDPEFADRFYKALVQRCGKTELGRRAKDARWFPSL
jgi:hypothetical protein